MIRYVTGNLLESSAHCLVNTVNCEGYMGKGIAYQFKLQFPENNKDYVKACKSGTLRIGTIHVYKEKGKIIVNFPTKDKWRERSRMSYVEAGLKQLVKIIENENITSIAIPPLGCGNGGLVWSDVKKLIEETLYPVEKGRDIEIYEPGKNYKAVPTTVPKVNVSSLVLLKLRMELDQFDALRLQKACYFLNYYLEEEYFKFDKWKYGPYSHSVDIVSRDIREYQKYYGIDKSLDTFNQIYQVICSDKVNKKIELILPNVEKATTYVNKIEENKMLEGVATVHFIIKKNNGILDSNEIVKHFKEWSDDKARRFSEQYIMMCIDYLEDTGLIIKNLLGVYELK